MVKMTNTQAAVLGLMPGALEQMKRVANGNGNLAWYGYAIGALTSRNALYTSIAVTIIATLGAIYLGPQFAAAKLCCKALTVLGGAGALFFGRLLYENISEIQTHINAIPLDS